MTKIAIVTGAGFSCAFGYPTTQQFFENIEKKITNTTQLKLLKSIRNVSDVRDIEHVLRILDNILIFKKDNLSMIYMTTIVRNLQVIDSNYNQWSTFIEHVSILREKIIDLIYDEYHFKESTQNEAFKAIDNLFMLKHAGFEITDIFTLNYDRLFEQYFLNNDDKYMFTDGFTVNKERRFWDGSLFNSNTFNNRTDNQKHKVRLFKLHGSLNWREWNNGQIESLPTEEPSRNSYYKKNLFIYPTEVCDESKEPYLTMYGHFKRLEQTVDKVIVIGYAFRDEPINEILKNFFFFGSGLRTVVAISPSINEDTERAFKDVSTYPRLQKIAGKFPEEETLSKMVKALQNRHF